MFDNLQQLCRLNGTSGDESRVADFIAANISETGTVIRRDSLGNVLVFKKGANTPKNLIMFAAHMDEVGFIVTEITPDGAKFAPVGGISPDVVFGRRVVFANGTLGVVGGKTWHLLSSEERDKQPKIDDLLIDTAGAEVGQGDYAYFVGGYYENNGRITAKALDNRVGCAVLLDLLAGEPEYDCVFAFTVQEEVGCKGAAAAAFNLEPDICIVLETTTACDHGGISGTAAAADSDKICELGKGAVISFMDKGCMYDRELYDIARSFDNTQTKSKVAGGNDASAIHKAMGGIRTIAVSVPCRYLHTPNCVVARSDVEAVRVLAGELIGKYAML
jgi:endoglucanase